VLISPYAVNAVSREKHQIFVSLTKKQLEDSPKLDTDLPVSRQYEDSYYGFYGWPVYWGGPNAWGMYPEITRDPDQWRGEMATADGWDPHLRSTKEVEGYELQATDGDIGKIVDFVIDDQSWSIRYLVVETGSWLAGKKVLIPPSWTERVSWEHKKVVVNVARSMIEHAPEYTGTEMLTREYESHLYRHYDRNGYWADEVRHAAK
jgi:hypothetical protein